jgi:hypothetical protein
VLASPQAPGNNNFRRAKVYLVPRGGIFRQALLRVIEVMRTARRIVTAYAENSVSDLPYRSLERLNGTVHTAPLDAGRRDAAMRTVSWP